MLNNVEMDVLPQTNARLSPAIPAHVRVHKKPLNILLVEDVASDALLTRIALNASRIPYKLRTIEKGHEVVPSLIENKKQSASCLPDVIMLDLGLPCKDGFEVLAELATTSAVIRAVPIIILTGYQHFEYITKTYNLWIPAYINKPCDPEQIRAVLGRIRNERERAFH